MNLAVSVSRTIDYFLQMRNRSNRNYDINSEYYGFLLGHYTAPNPDNFIAIIDSRRHRRPHMPWLARSLLPNAPGSARKTFHAAKVSHHAHPACGRGFAFHRLRTPDAPWLFPALNQPGRTPHFVECSARRHVTCRPAPTVTRVPTALHCSPDAKARSETWNHWLGASEWAQRHLVGRKI